MTRLSQRRGVARKEGMNFRRGWIAPGFGILIALLAMAGGLRNIRAAQQAPQPASAAQQQNPQPSAYTLPPEKLAKAVALSRIENILDIVDSLWQLGVLWLLLASGAAARLETWASRTFPHRWQQGLLFFIGLIVVLDAANLPLDIFGHIVSRHFGISVQGWPGWLADQGKALGLAIAVGAPVLLLFNWIVRRWPRRYWLGAWMATLPLMLLSVFASPFIEPLFNRYEPLAKDHSALVQKLEELVARTGTDIPPDRMFLMKASEKSNGLNAYVSGLGATKRIVVWDTTAGRIPNDEVMFIFGHESGHYVLHHIPKMMAISAVGLFFIYRACAGFAAWLVGRFGARWKLPADAALASRSGFVVLLFAVALAMFVLEPVSNTISRHFEHEADIYGQEAIHGLVPDPQKTAVASFDALGEAWLEDPDPSPFIEFWEYNHPSVKTRANFAAHYDPWANGGHGRFFDH
jgi:STE24 endopeptidase